MITNEITFHAPDTKAEALGLLAEYGEDATVLGGGMSLLPMMNLGIVQPDVVVSLNHVTDMSDVQEQPEQVRIGALVRHRDVARHPLVVEHCPVLAAAAKSIGDVQVRNRGTIGGSVAHADPAADYLPVLAAVGGTITMTGSGGERTVTPDEFFIDVMFTTREPDEIVTAISVPKVGGGFGSGFDRLCRVEGSFAIVNAAAIVARDRSSARIGLGGVGPKPAVIDVTEQVANGLDDRALESVGDAAYEAAAEATGDIMSDAEYRREMARVFASRALRQAVAAADQRSA